MTEHNIVYVSGAHGSGKSTLIKTLVEEEPARYLRFERIPIPKVEDVVERAKIRTARYYLQTFAEGAIAREHPEQMLLCDRSVLDNWGYMLGFREIEWITRDQEAEFRKLVSILYPPERLPKNVIFIDPPLETLIKHIKQRWARGEKKWHEDDFAYLDAVRKGFQRVYETYDGNVLRVKSTDLGERLTQCKEWMTGITADQAR